MKLSIPVSLKRMMKTFGIMELTSNTISLEQLIYMKEFYWLDLMVTVLGY